MKLLNASVNLHEGYANPPTLEIHVDKTPPADEFIYQRVLMDESHLYFAQHEDGYVSFYCHSPRNEHGFGGHTFNLRMRDGTVRAIKGPWSSRAGVMNNVFPHCVDVTFIESTGSRLAGAASLELAKKAAKIAGCKLVQERRDYDITYRIEV